MVEDIDPKDVDETMHNVSEAELSEVDMGDKQVEKKTRGRKKVVVHTKKETDDEETLVVKKDETPDKP